MELKYHYKNIGSALQARIRTEQIMDYEELGKDFMQFYAEMFVFHDDDFEDTMTELTKKIFFTNNTFDIVIANWFLQSNYITSFAVLENLIESDKNGVIKYSVFKNSKIAARCFYMPL